MALAEVLEDFGWTEKELRNKVAVWRGYKEISDAGGWAALVFAGMGLYRFCKYRVGFTSANMATLRHFRNRFEVAADTLHPSWRQLLKLVGEPGETMYTGHPHDWVVSVGRKAEEHPVPLQDTYRQWDSSFTFEHLQLSIIDGNVWGEFDPRLACRKVTQSSGQQSLSVSSFTCRRCSGTQSMNLEVNDCHCYSQYFGPGHHDPSPVQVFRTENGRNNGLIACRVSFTRLVRFFPGLQLLIGVIAIRARFRDR